MARNIRSAAELQAQTHELSNLRTALPRISEHGDPLHLALDAQLQVLRTKLTEQDIYRIFADDYVLEAAMTARRWLNDEDEPSPAETWLDEYGEDAEDFDIDSN